MRIQILELPAEHHGDDMTTPFAVIIDQATPDQVEALREERDTYREFMKEIGARDCLVTRHTLDIL